MEIDDDWWRHGKSSDDEDSWEEDSEETAETYPRCRACGAEFFDDDTVRCPSCGSYQSEEDDPAPRHRGWVIFTAILLVFITLYWLAKHGLPAF